MSVQISRPEDVRSEAARWFTLQQSGDMSRDDALRFHDWLTEAAAHEQAFAQIERAWSVAGLTAQDPEILAIRSEHSEPEKPERSRWPIFEIAASFLLIAVMGWAMLGGVFPERKAAEYASQTFQTAPQQRTDVKLSDGSVITLDAESMLVLHETPTERRMELAKGRAYFRVAKDPSRPFIVDANGKSVRALGTIFEVSIDHDNIVVTLTEGKVRVADASKGAEAHVEMSPGRQLIARNDQNWSMRKVDTSKETSWVSGRLTYMNDPLSVVVSDMNRYSKRKLRFEGGHIPNRQIVGVFEAGDVDSFIKALELNDIAYIVSERDGEIVLSAD